MNLSRLEPLGWSPWFDEQASLRCDTTGAVARVAAIDRDQLLLLDESGVFRAKLSGKFRYEAADSLQDLPCVGDWVCVDKSEADRFGLVRAVLERKTGLVRRAAGDPAGIQQIAANVDVVIIVQSCHYDFNLKRLERILLMVSDGGAAPWVLLTKTDLVGPDVVAGQLDRIQRAGVTAPVLTLSNVTGEGVRALKTALSPGKTYCFVGSSGVGKSTLVNGLLGREVLDTNAVSGTGEGRHTTVRRELIVLDNGALVIDNPGTREFGVLAGEDAIDATYPDIAAISSQCRFRDCTHSSEPGCAVLDAVKEGEIDRDHYENSLKLRKESRFHQMSNVEKRKRDKAFGKMVKSIKKDLD